jgi:hypothetical protein
MGGACTSNGKEKECVRVTGRNKERDHWEDEDVGGWIILGWILER